MKSIVFIAMLCLSCVLQAHVFCVYEEDDTGDAACTGGYCGLIQALAAVSDGGAYNGEDSYIDVVVGTYHTKGTAFQFTSTANPGHIMDISGGFSAGCASQQQTPHGTIFAGDATSRVLMLDNAYGPTGVRWLTIQNGNFGSGGGCEVNGNLSSDTGGDVNFNYNIVRNNSSTVAGGGCYLRSRAALRMFGNLFKGNSAAQFGAAEIAAEGSLAYLYNNTFTLNTSAAPVQIGAVSYAGITTGQLINNIFYGNTGGDIWAFASVVATNNDYHDYGGLMPDPSSNGNIDTDPLFVGPGNLRVENGSPTIATGTTTAPGGLPTIDIEGFARTYNGLVDMGAYSHDVIFTDGFDDN